ncbi:odorant receptor 46a-like isoform X2 [Temnothorax americanus]|uniref:odorant receptor 46a-like isoform X2 n=1 Tax=Temnothorax americanus TaxID=1964332 RepID=UPI004067B025
MDILPLNFRIFWFCGAWSEEKDNNLFVRCLSLCYRIFRYAIVTLLYEFTILEVIELVRTHNNIEDITEGLFLALTYVAFCFKYGNFLARQNEVSMLLDCFRSETCQPRNSEEKMILLKYDRKAKWCVRTFMSISQATCIALILAPIVGPQNSDRPLPVKTYLPYSISGLYPYLATYLQHVGAIFYGVLLNVSFDSLVYGFTLHACGQIELLRYRLSKIFKDRPEQYRIDSSKGTTMISECVRHHLYVHEIVRRIQSLFVWTVAILFIFSMVTLCTSIFQMSKKKILTVKFLSLTMYLGCMLFQVFFYCWYGNELQLKSRGIGDAIYSSDWTTATTQDRRSLLFVMAISQKGLNLSYYGIFSLGIDTFTGILKMSYSTFNVLQQSM